MKKLLLIPFTLLIILSLTSTASAKKRYKGRCKGWGKTMLMAKHKSTVRYH